MSGAAGEGRPRGAAAACAPVKLKVSSKSVFSTSPEMTCELSGGKQNTALFKQKLVVGSSLNDKKHYDRDRYFS